MNVKSSSKATFILIKPHRIITHNKTTHIYSCLFARLTADVTDCLTYQVIHGMAILYSFFSDLYGSLTQNNNMV